MALRVVRPPAAFVSATASLTPCAIASPIEGDCENGAFTAMTSVRCASPFEPPQPARTTAAAIAAGASLDRVIGPSLAHAPALDRGTPRAPAGSAPPPR